MRMKYEVLKVVFRSSPQTSCGGHAPLVGYRAARTVFVHHKRGAPGIEVVPTARVGREVRVLA